VPIPLDVFIHGRAQTGSTVLLDDLSVAYRLDRFFSADAAVFRTSRHGS